MDLLPLSCQHCSAPLRVPESAKFVTCTHCGTQLAIRKTGGAAYTETLEAIDQRTERMAGQIDDLHRRTALADLDRQWEQECSRYRKTDKDGEIHEPSTTGSILGGLLIAGFGLFWMCGAFNAASAPGAPWLFRLAPLFGLIFLVLGIGHAVSGSSDAQAYERAKRRYQEERNALLDAEQNTPDSSVN